MAGKKGDGFIGKYCLVRGPAGVYAGTLESQEGGEVVMTGAFCLWKWSGAATLLDVAEKGVGNASDCRFSIVVDRMKVMEVFQILPCSRAAEKNLSGVKKWSI